MTAPYTTAAATRTQYKSLSVPIISYNNFPTINAFLYNMLFTHYEQKITINVKNLHLGQNSLLFLWN